MHPFVQIRILIQNQPLQSEIINNRLGFLIPVSNWKRMMHAPVLGQLFYNKQVCRPGKTLSNGLS